MSDPGQITNPDADIITVRPDSPVTTVQSLPYFVGVSGKTAGAESLSMSLVVVPPGAVSEPHVHIGYETAIYVLSGQVETRYGTHLEKSVVNGPGDFVFVPPGLPHQARNLSDTEPARAIVARNDPYESEQVMAYLPPDVDRGE
jgi:uncharacterized RmlC-like cupin family protein